MAPQKATAAFTTRRGVSSARPFGRLARPWLAALAGGLMALSAQATTHCPAGTEAAGVKQRIYGLGLGGELLRFNACNPGQISSIGSVSGLQGSDTQLVGIDFRVQDGLLYGVGNAGGIYTLDLSTAAATKASQLSTALDGSQFGVDFNPAANALRIISNTGQNLRHPFALPEPRITLVDLPLNYTAGTIANGIVAAAYTNNDLDPNTATTLFDIDATLAQVVVQVPPNNGSLAATGKLGVTPTGPVGFDILSTVNATGVSNNIGVMSASVGGVSSLYRINLLTGRASSLGALGQPLADLAVTLD